jgi:hypothetical protein
MSHQILQFIDKTGEAFCQTIWLIKQKNYVNLALWKEIGRKKE